MSLDFMNIYDILAGFMPEGMEWLAFIIAAVALSFIVINVMMLSTAGLYLVRAQGSGQVPEQARAEPVGTVRDTSADSGPGKADNERGHDAGRGGPLGNDLRAAGSGSADAVGVAVIPFGTDSFLGRLNIGILFVLGVTSVNTIAIFMAGWGSANKYAMLGAMRGVAMLVSYEVPMALGVVGVVILSGSMALFDIVETQTIPFLIVQPLGFLIFVAAASAEMSRTPFDQIEAESELGSGYNTEYSGIKFAILFLAEFMAPIITALVITVLFLGGTNGFDPIPGQVWFVLKTFAVIFALLWVRATWPRLRVDQIMGFAWKGLFALSAAEHLCDSG